MKRFIVPTDFSINAQHASAYAVQLARQLSASITLMHAYEAPVPVSEYEIGSLHFEAMKGEIIDRLNERKLELEQEFGKEVPIDTVVFNDNLIDNIKKLYGDPEAKLAVIGLTGAGMVNFFLGSNTLNIVNSVGRIVLTVPPYAEFRPIRKVVFACDMWNVAVTVPAERIKRIMTLLNAELLVLNIQKPQAPSPEAEAEKETLEQMLKGIPFSFHAIKKRNIIAAIKDFAKEQQADLIAIIPRKYDFLENLLRTNHTKAMLFKSG
ncbi:MAG TPA: universal stress protein, partial [Chitinophagaceae bacterium]|nr:universal stress protein [Chitinophagaceae bacterium]